MSLLQRIEYSLPHISLDVLDERTNPTGFVLDEVEDDEDVDIGTCSTCGGYGVPGRECRRPSCIESGGTFC